LFSSTELNLVDPGKKETSREIQTRKESEAKLISSLKEKVGGKKKKNWKKKKISD
jgi:hypothetical protein